MHRAKRKYKSIVSPSIVLTTIRGAGEPTSALPTASARSLAGGFGRHDRTEYPDAGERGEPHPAHDPHGASFGATGRETGLPSFLTMNTKILAGSV
jgi:hypothetical protein